MKRLLKGAAGQLEVAAGETGVSPGRVRVRVGHGLLYTLFLSAAEAQELGEALNDAANAAGGEAACVLEKGCARLGGQCLGVCAALGRPM